MLIQIRSLRKNYDQQAIIDDVSFDIMKGEIFGIVGKSGVGKSTLLRCINGLEPITSGDIVVDNFRLASLDSDGVRSLRRKVSMIFQNFNLLNQKTALENVMLPMEVWGMDKQPSKEKAMSLLDLVGLKEKYHSRPKSLSGGEKQRVAIARALALDPEILLCDEATSALDPKTTKEILFLLKEINKSLGLTLVVVTHQMEVIKEICQRVCVMESGKVSALGKVEDLFLNPEVSLKKLLGEEDLEILPKGTNLRIFFTKEFSDEAIITNMSRDLSINFSIVWGKLENFNGSVLGSLVLHIHPEDEHRIREYLTQRGLKWEVIKNES